MNIVPWLKLNGYPCLVGFCVGIITIIMADAFIFQGFNADWVNATCNIVIAAAALYAALNAKNWLTPIIYKEGIPIADALMAELKAMKLIINNSETCKCIASNLDGIQNDIDVFAIGVAVDRSHSRLSKITSDAKKLTRNAQDIESSIHKIKHHKAHIERYSWTINKNIERDFHLLIKLAHSICSDINAITERVNFIRAEDKYVATCYQLFTTPTTIRDDTIIEKYQGNMPIEIIKNLNAVIIDMKKSEVTFNETYEAIFTHHKTVADFFN